MRYTLLADPLEAYDAEMRVLVTGPVAIAVHLRHLVRLAHDLSQTPMPALCGLSDTDTLELLTACGQDIAQLRALRKTLTLPPHPTRSDWRHPA